MFRLQRIKDIKGDESSSQFRWFAIAEIET